VAAARLGERGQPMKISRFLKTYVMLAVAVGLVAYAYLVESKKEPSADKKEKVLVFDRKKATEISVSSAAGEPLRVTRQGEAWQLVAPLTAPADTAEVESVLSSLEGLEAEEVVAENATDLAPFGLATPRLTLAVLIEGVPEPLQLQVGDKTPDGHSLYARLPGKPRVFLLPSYLQGTFEKKPFDLRDRSVLHLKRDEVQQLDVTGPEGEYSLARAEGDAWTVTRPLTTLASRWGVDGLLGTLEGLRMESVVEEEAKDLKPYGLDKPARAVALTMKDGGTRRLELGSKTADGKYHARDASSSRVVLVLPSIVDDLAKGLAERRVKRLLEVASYEVVGIEVEADGGKRVYSRSSEKGKDGADAYKWKRTAPDAKDVETNRVQDALFLVGGIEVQEFVDKPGAPQAYGLDAPAVKVALKYEGTRPAATFELGQKDGALYARRTGDNAVLKIDASKGPELFKTFKEL
jgi:uncharacterized protein DUF4340